MVVKLVVAVRTDLDMGRGKMAAQVGHASVEAALSSKAKRPRDFDGWMASGQQKVVVKVGSMKELTDLLAIASSKGIAMHPIRDAGHTQVEPGTMTCCAFGPAEEGALDAVTGHLKLL